MVNYKRKGGRIQCDADDMGSKRDTGQVQYAIHTLGKYRIRVRVRVRVRVQLPMDQPHELRIINI